MQMYRLTGPLFFASSEKVLTRLSREVTARTLVLDLTKARPIDSATTDRPRRLAERQWLRGGELRLIGLNQRLLASINNQSAIRFSAPSSRGRRATSNAFQAPEENNHDQSTALRPM
jgi:MFS superfamily sulfate permease-like transporter